MDDAQKRELPSSAQLKQELARVRYRQRYNSVMLNTVYILLAVAAIAVLVATLLLPVLRIYGTSMTPSFSEGDLVVSVKNLDMHRGDVISFYYSNKILVKRVIALEGEWVRVDTDGNVYVNDEMLDEPYLPEKALGECDIKFPYQVPDGRYFVMGDHRISSVDSRSSAVGCVFEEQVVGRILFRVWPLSKFGPVK